MLKSLVWICQALTTQMSEAKSLHLTPSGLTLDELRGVFTHPVRVTLDDQLVTRIEASAECVQAILDRGETAYGINTGFGLLANTTIAADQLAELQKNLVLSHSTGVGERLPDEVVRLILVLKVASLAQGHSGARLRTIEALIDLLNRDIYPCIPAKGSVGASGDLAPLAHLAATLLGEGYICHFGTSRPAAEVLCREGIETLHLGPKEGLALLNGTQVSTALALAGLFRAERLFTSAVISGALSVDAAMGSDAPFDQRIHDLRRHPGQLRVARAYREILEGSEIRASHVRCERVQDPYCLRCQPQVMGACRDNLQNAARTLLIEANAVTDNPLVFADSGEVISGGNFHAEPVAMAADGMALAIAEIGALAERRIALLIDPHMSGLPPFLVANSGLNSGFMIAHVTAAALASENKSLSHPAVVDSMPTSANQEDHVSMATFAARRLGDMVVNSANIIAIELLSACQGVEFHSPLRSSPPLTQVQKLIRDHVPSYTEDRFFAPDIEAVRHLVEEGAVREAAGLSLHLE